MTQHAHHGTHGGQPLYREARVWAPRASTVLLHRERDGVAEQVPMERGADDWWTAPGALVSGTATGSCSTVTSIRCRTRRSRRQPDGVHGLSALDDPAAHHWADTHWTGRQLAGAAIYELHIGTFTPGGTLDSAIHRLDHLVDLGIDFVEVLPVNGFNGTHNWGYDGVLWYAVHEGYGGPAGLPPLRRGLPRARARRRPGRRLQPPGPSGNYLPRFGPYLREGSANTWGDSVAVDEPEVRRFILDNLAMWFEDFHVDGLRLDAVHALLDDPENHILEAMAVETDARSAHLGRPLTLIAESDMNDPRLILPREAGGYGLHAQWSDDHHHAIHTAVSGEDAGYYADFATSDALLKTSTEGFFHNGTFSSFRERDHGAPIPTEVPTWRLVTCAQNHDQIGNRAAGDRLSQSLTEDQLAVTAVLNLTAPFTPMLFMGEEWGASTPWQFFTSHPEPELGRATAEGRLAEFVKMGWDESVVPDPQDPDTFTRSRLDWDELDGRGPDTARHRRLFALHRDLLRLRRATPELTDPRFAHTTAITTAPVGEYPVGSFQLTRGAGVVDDDSGVVTVCVAFATGATFAIDSTADVAARVLLSTSTEARLVPEHRAGSVELILPAWSAAIVRVR